MLNLWKSEKWFRKVENSAPSPGERDLFRSARSAELLEKCREKIEALRSVRVGHLPVPSKTKSLSIDMWLIDTGCGHDLVTRSDTTKMKSFLRLLLLCRRLPQLQLRISITSTRIMMFIYYWNMTLEM